MGSHVPEKHLSMYLSPFLFGTALKYVLNLTLRLQRDLSMRLSVVLNRDAFLNNTS